MGVLNFAHSSLPASSSFFNSEDAFCNAVVTTSVHVSVCGVLILSTYLNMESRKRISIIVSLPGIYPGGSVFPNSSSHTTSWRLSNHLSNTVCPFESAFAMRSQFLKMSRYFFASPSNAFSFTYFNNVGRTTEACQLNTSCCNAFISAGVIDCIAESFFSIVTPLAVL